ncbi:hypothetical protein CC86DRAFT_443464 [Ophiobolus disseminans]|uniref:Uncharacterized protein n=1 Tax=Ophiobolus disseminans TaxID=1469910 RepID=A0A6A7AB67_9PLEO|nr:hypothetical protein CC86DRAFT_443464 [Ophiobolus disseminans]
MTPRTRSSNQDANDKVYYSKKVAQQRYFPHKRKTVRRPSAANDDSGKKQMRFLPEKMRIRRDVADSEEEDDEDEDMEDGGVAIPLKVEDEEDGRHVITGETTRGRGHKRRRGSMEADSEDNDEPTGPTLKRRRKPAAPRRRRRSRQVDAEAEPEFDDEDVVTPNHTKPKVDRSRTLRRQSTMTQLVEGRRPLSDTEEPAFKPVKRSSRLSWGGQSKKGKDQKQRTLTQMIPGMKPLEIESDEDLAEELNDKAAQERDNQAYGEAIATRLAQEGLYQDRSDEVEAADTEDQFARQSESRQNGQQGEEEVLSMQTLQTPSLVIDSIENETTEDEESYQSTQFIDAPITRTRQSPRRASARKPRIPQATEAPLTAPQRTARSKFGLLSTPEKRRIRVIPSSQSPPESPLSTQISPSKAIRAPLQERSGNATQGAETPSKRKQVAFQLPAKEPAPPPTLRKFRSVIQDSEDDEDDIIEEGENRVVHHVDTRTQAAVQNVNDATHGRDVGHETQAMLDQIDQACANADDNAGWASRESSEELGVSIFDREQESSQELGVSIFDREQESSPELGELPTQRNAPQPKDTANSYRITHAGIKQEPSHYELPVTTQVPSSPPMIQHPVEDTCPSTPLVIMDSSDEEDELEPTPPHQSTRIMTQASSHTLQQSADLDGALIQVPRSPAHHESQKSHSSKAEQQLQNEWSSYSQYINARPGHTSSMNVAHDKYSYDATPRPPRPIAQQHYMSQATTVDEVTPRKNRTQRTISANTTPRKIASSQPMSSPSKPPPLFIPSSFPSPTKARMDEWSSPVYGRTQETYGLGYNGGSLEDFSIPLPPPVEEDDD